MLIHSSSKVTVGLAVSVFYALALIATCTEARSFREEDAKAIRQHVETENHLLFKRQGYDERQPYDEIGMMAHSKSKKPHHSRKVHTTTKFPGLSLTTDTPEDTTMLYASTKGPEDTVIKASEKHKAPTKKPEDKLTTTTRKSKSKTTKKKKSKKNNKTPAPSTTTSKPDSSTKEPSKTGLSSFKHTPEDKGKEKADPKGMTTINPAYKAVINNQEYTALEHMIAGVDNWLKVLKLSGGKVFNRFLAGELMHKLDNEVKSKLGKEDKADKLIEAFLKKSD